MAFTIKRLTEKLFCKESRKEVDIEGLLEMEMKFSVK